MNALTPTSLLPRDEVIIRQESQEVYVVTLELASLTPTGESLEIERERLIDHIITHQYRDLAALRSELGVREQLLAAATSKLSSLDGELAIERATSEGRQKVIERLTLESGSANSEAVQAKQATIERLAGECADLRARIGELERELAASKEGAAAAGDASARAADAYARLAHVEARRDELAASLQSEQTDKNHLAVQLKDRQAKLATAEREVRQLRDSLAVADRGKQNALAALETRLREAHALELQAVRSEYDGVAAVDQKELTTLRRQAKQVPDLEREIARLQEKCDGLLATNKTYKGNIKKLEAEQESFARTMEKAQNMLTVVNGHYAQARRDVDYAYMSLRAFNNQPEYKSDSGRLTIMSLHPGHIQSTDNETIHPDKPICWWNTPRGLGCVVMYSAAPRDDDGEHYLIFPSFSVTVAGVDETIDIAKAVMPPKDEWPAIIEHFKQMSAKEMQVAMEHSEAAAIAYTEMKNPDAEAKILAMLRARQSSTAVIQRKQGKSAKKRR
ncbi:hypothetical protein [Aeromonas sp. Y311-2]|uniref:hypothetical protein n=1 Tax=Aeromonas sp. Y311-2 TaxID=2990507 RepID=UPI0022E25C50|nr:hypothetical protein [Aeromonas sp. Y311-2]